MAPWVKIIQGDSRLMPELNDTSVDLVVTSPPYWHLKDYGVHGQIGYHQRLHDYLRDLYRVWSEVFRVLRPGRRLCINIGDQFARARVYGRYKVIPLHAEVISQCELLGFDYLGSIIWQKRTTMNTSGGATIMGSYPYPPNGIVEIDYEFILIFKKPGRTARIPADIKQASRMSKEEWKTFFSGHWTFGGARQIEHEAVFPPELPRRLIRMFSLVGETVLDPFAGSGTTLEQAILAERNAIGYEINPRFIELIRHRLEQASPPLFAAEITVQRRENQAADLPPVEYTPRIQDAAPQTDPGQHLATLPELYRVRAVENETLVLNNDQRVTLLGVQIMDHAGFDAYAKKYLLGKQVFLRFDSPTDSNAGNTTCAYVYLKNKIFINAYLIKAGLARPSGQPHRLQSRFQQLWKEYAPHGQGMDPQSGNQSLGAE